MKISFTILILVFFLTFTSNCFSEDNEAKRVLFLGNSVFYSRGGLCPSFEGFCKAAGLNYQAVSQWNTPVNTLGIEFLNYGRIPLNLPEVAADNEIHDLIRSGQFDYVIVEGRRSGFLLPEMADLPDHRGQHIPYKNNLDALAAIHSTIAQSGAQTVLYMHPGMHMTADSKHPLAQIYVNLFLDLERLKFNGERHKVILVPAMLLWLDALKRYGVEGWYADPTHGNALARYASACMLYTYITGNDPRENDFKKLTELTQSWGIIPEKSNLLASDDDAQWIKNQVWLYYSTRIQ